METGQDKNDYKIIVEKIKGGMKFGLFEDGQKCYFEDGTRVGYGTIWLALHEVYPLESTLHKTMFQLCPDAFAGIFPYKFSKHNWKKKPVQNR